MRHRHDIDIKNIQNIIKKIINNLLKKVRFIFIHIIGIYYLLINKAYILKNENNILLITKLKLKIKQLGIERVFFKAGTTRYLIFGRLSTASVTMHNTMLENEFNVY